jgi:photosystem II stability/assembly factor-like uncharacterized protein
MNKRMLWSRVLCVAGIALIILGCIWINSPGSMSELCLLSGSGLVALSAFLGKSYYRTFVYGVLGLAVIGVPAYITYSHGYPAFWIRELAHPLPLVYGIGLLAALTGAMLVLFESPRASMPTPGVVPVSTRRWWWSRMVSLVGLAVMPIVIFLFVASLVVQIVGPMTPASFYVFLLAISGLPAFGAFLGKSRHRTFLYVALVPTVCGTIAALLFDFHQDQFIWAYFFLVAYSLGLIMSCVGAVLVIFESFHRARVFHGPRPFDCLRTAYMVLFIVLLALQFSWLHEDARPDSSTGGHWEQLPLHEGTILSLAIDPLTPTTLHAGTYEDGVFRSTDSGHHWTAVTPGLSNQPVRSLAINPATPSTLYAGTDGGVFRSTDAGDHWQAVSAGLRNQGAISLAVDPVTPTTLYAGTAGSGVFCSRDAGDHWQQATTGLTNQAVRSLAINPVPPITLYAGTYNGGGVFRSGDAGDHWQAVSTGLTNQEVVSLAVDSVTPTTLYAGTVGSGVFRSTNGGTTWTVMNAGLTNQVVWSLAIGPLTPTTLYAGTDGGVFRWLPER